MVNQFIPAEIHAAAGRASGPDGRNGVALGAKQDSVEDVAGQHLAGNEPIEYRGIDWIGEPVPDEPGHDRKMTKSGITLADEALQPLDDAD
jgi:hypothetical protein